MYASRIFLAPSRPAVGAAQLMVAERPACPFPVNLVKCEKEEAKVPMLPEVEEGDESSRAQLQTVDTQASQHRLLRYSQETPTRVLDDPLSFSGRNSQPGPEAFLHGPSTIKREK